MPILVASRFRNTMGPIVDPTDPQWGASGTSDDSATFQNALDAVGSGGGVFYMPAGTWRVQDLVPPSGVSFSVIGASKGATILRPPVASGAATVWDFTGCNGPVITFEKFKIEGRVTGTADTTGMLFNTTNGVRVRDVWYNGLLYGTDWTGTNTDDTLVNCNYDVCATGNRLNVPTPSLVHLLSMAYNHCAQDLQVSSADCRTFIHANAASFGGLGIPRNIGIYAVDCTNLVLDGYCAEEGGGVGVQLDNCQDAVLRNVRLTGMTTDYVSNGSYRVFAEGCNGNLSPFIGAQLFCGVQVANKRRMVSTAVPSTLAWGAGDRVENSAPASGNPKAWICTVSGTPGTWVSEGNL